MAKNCFAPSSSASHTQRSYMGGIACELLHCEVLCENFEFFGKSSAWLNAESLNAKPLLSPKRVEISRSAPLKIEEHSMI